MIFSNSPLVFSKRFAIEKKRGKFNQQTFLVWILPGEKWESLQNIPPDGK
jgi:hypothetical protein